MSWVDNDFADRIGITLSNYKKVSENPYKINARCPICGDSLRNKSKARFWIYTHKTQDALCVKCFNCDYSSYFGTFLKDQNPTMYREYIIAKRKESVQFTLPSKSKPKEQPVKQPNIESFDNGITMKYCDRIDTLPDNHPIVKYVSDRQIPKDKWHLLYFTTQWKKFVNTIKQTYKDEQKEPRLVIPIFQDDRVVAVQGRALRQSDNIKYITIKMNDDVSKLYGTERIDDTKPVLITEGPIDSLFLDNAIAITGGTADPSDIPYQNKIWVMDNEPRAIDTLNRIKSLIKSGETVLLWDKFNSKEKDINEMIKSGSSKEDLMEYILGNAVSGLSAELRFAKYAKV